MTCATSSEFEMKQTTPESSEETAELRTLADVERVIATHRDAFSSHAFLSRLEGSSTLDQFKRFAPRVAFFVMCFQDVLRLVHSCSTQPAIREMARVHALEDKGHDLWYLDDLQRLDASVSVAWLFSDEHQLTRDVAHGQIARVLAAEFDETRLAVALSLEAVGAECFGRAIGLLERLGESDGLQYFARKHQAIEQGHQVFEHESQSQLAAVTVPDAARGEVLEAITSTFEGMATLLSDLLRAIDAPARAPR